MKRLIAPLASALLVAMASSPAHAQHAGHEHHVMPAKPAAQTPAPKKPAAKSAAKKPPAKKPAAKKPAPVAAKPAARPAAKPRATPAVDHAAMGHGAHGGHAPKPAARPAVRPAKKSPAPRAPRAPAKPAVDHAAMGHAMPPDAPSAVDHAAMGHDTPASSNGHEGMAHGALDHAAMDHGAMDHGAMSPEEHAAMGHAPAELPADAAPRTPIPVLTDADRAAAFPQLQHGHATHDRRIHSYWLADRLEWQDTDEGALAWEGVAWIGGDIHRLWLRSEGEASDGEVEHRDVEVLYGRSITPWWDVVAGVRQDFGHGPSRTWAAVGVQGLAPYKFEVEATAYVGRGGRTAASFEVEYDTLVTNRLILQWQAEASLHGRDDPAAGVASGLSTVEAGARLRYEFSRRFAPYVGVQVERAFGGTADLRRQDGEPTRDTRLVAGIRFWF